MNLSSCIMMLYHVYTEVNNNFVVIQRVHFCLLFCNQEDVQLPEVEPEEKPIPPVAIQEEIQKPSESFQERRATAIAAKAQEIEKVTCFLLCQNRLYYGTY